MNPIETERKIDNMNLTLGISQGYHSGACTRDTTDTTDSAPEYHSRHTIKRVVIGTIRFNRQTGEIVEKNDIRGIPRGYNFQI